MSFQGVWFEHVAQGWPNGSGGSSSSGGTSTSSCSSCSGGSSKSGGSSDGGSGRSQEMNHQRDESDSIAHQTAALGAWGLIINLAVLLASDAAWLGDAMWPPKPGLGADGAASLLGSPHRACAFTSWNWCAALSIAGADLSMAVFFVHLGSNAYSFSRILAMGRRAGAPPLDWPHAFAPRSLLAPCPALPRGRAFPARSALTSPLLEPV